MQDFVQRIVHNFIEANQEDYEDRSPYQPQFSDAKDFVGLQSLEKGKNHTVLLPIHENDEKGT